MANPASFGSNERDIEQALVVLKKGTQLVKYCRTGKPKFVPFRLSSDETSLIWISHGREKSLNLSSVTRIIPGQRTAVFRRYLRPEKDYLSFSLIYKKGERSLDLICKDEAEVEVWFAGLKALISTGQNSRRTRFELTNDSVDFLQFGRPFVGPIEFPSNTSNSRTSFESVSHESQSFQDVGSEYSNMAPSRTSVGDNSRVSVSSIGYASSAGSGLDDIESLGDVYIWGEVWTDVVSTDGLGSQFSKTDVLTPKPIESNVVLDVDQIACGASHIALVTRQGEVFTWGEDHGGRLGHGFDKDFVRPQLVESLAVTNMGLVACGEYHTCTVSTSGDLFTWGDGVHNAGLLGHGMDIGYWIPKKVIGLLEGLQVVFVACGTWHSAMVTSNGKLFTWGDGTFGVLGHGHRESLLSPKEVQLLSGQKAIKVACGVWHTAAIIEAADQSSSNLVARKVFTWGDGDQYNLGHLNKDTYLQPTCVSSLVEYNFNQIACGHTMTVALSSSGQVFTMGSTAYGQLGIPMSDGKQPLLVLDRLLGEFVEEISCGAYHVAVLTSRSELYTWGRGANGRLGHGDTDDRNSPTLVEALKDKHVKNISCGSNFTSCICIHKWMSADQSTCSGCRQPFSFTRKRHNCYNCGLVHCHACSSKKSMKAALAPTPSKPHRVCDACYAKLKVSESSSSFSFNIEGTRRYNSIYRKEKFDRGGVRSSKIFSTTFTEPVKYLGRSIRGRSQDSSSSIVLPDQQPSQPPTYDALLNSLNAKLYPSKPVKQPSQPPTPPTPSTSRPTSPYARRPSPPRSNSPGFSRSIADSLKKTNEILNQEVSKLQNQVRSLKKRSDRQGMKIQELQQNVEEATSLAGEESSKHMEAKEFIKSIKDQLREVTEKLPPEIPCSDTLRTMHAQAEDFLQARMKFESSSFLSSLESEEQSAAADVLASGSVSSKLQELRLEEDFDAAEVGPAINGEKFLQESRRLSVSGAGSPLPSSENRSRSLDSNNEPGRGEKKVVEQFERGVYVTLVVQPSGSAVFKHIRFSKRRFDERQAEEWWNQNKDRLLRKYCPEDAV